MSRKILFDRKHVHGLYGDAEDGAVQTASPSADLVLDGIMRRSIIRCCQELGVQVVESAPNVSDRHLWQEGFLTNWWVP